MMSGPIAFFEFKRLASGLRDWGYEVRQEDDYGEFEYKGYICTYRFFDVLDIQFLKPGQTLQTRHEPDVVLSWDGEVWNDIFDTSKRMTTAQLFSSCVRTVHFMMSTPFTFDARYCLMASTNFLENQTSG